MTLSPANGSILASAKTNEGIRPTTNLRLSSCAHRSARRRVSTPIIRWPAWAPAIVQRPQLQPTSSIGSPRNPPGNSAIGYAAFRRAPRKRLPPVPTIAAST